MAKREKMIVALMVLVGGLMLAGCQTHSYSKIENEVYSYVNRFSRRIPKEFVKTVDHAEGSPVIVDGRRLFAGGEVCYRDSGLVTSEDDDNILDPEGKGRMVYTKLGGRHTLFAGYVARFTRLDTAGKKYILFTVLRTQSEFIPTNIILAKPEGWVIYGRTEEKAREEPGELGNWKRCEISAGEISADKWWPDPLYYSHVCLKPGADEAPKEVIRKYLDLADRLNDTYFKQEIEDTFTELRFRAEPKKD